VIVSEQEILDPELRDPVCGRHITETSALLRDEDEGRTYLFCSERCRMLFSLRPEAYAVRGGETAADEATVADDATAA
jgi:YHS domain-containing protein